MKDHLTIRTMTRDEVSLAVEWAAAEGWNPGLHDADVFYAADPEGFLIARLGEEPVGCISAIAYPEAFGFIGFYIVAAAHRGRGFGLRLWQRAMAKLDGLNIGLDGVVEQQPNYRKSGFRLAYRNIRFEGRGLASGGPRIPGLSAAAPDDIGDIAQYDRLCFPSRRDAFLRLWLDRPGSHTVIARGSRGLTGYGVVRPCRAGCKIGPLFADDQRQARMLVQELCRQVPPGEPVYLDVPEVNGAAMRLAGSFGMKEVFGTARMYTGTDPDVDISRVFGVTSFELG